MTDLLIAEPGYGGPRRLSAPQASASGLAPWRPKRQSVQLAWLAGVAALGLLAGALVIRPLSGARRHAGPQVLSRLGLTSLPLAARVPVSAALGGDEPGYRVLGLHARNPAQRLRVAFSRAGVTVASGNTHVHLALVAYGYGTALEHVRSVSPQVHANRVAYSHAGVREWYANGPLGLEQGFDVAAAPSRGQGPLTLSLALSGDVHAHLERSDVLLRGAGAVLRYGGLEVSDARGRRLDSWLELAPGRLLIRVDDRGASYPLQIDPLVQAAELSASDGGIGDELGWAVATSGNTIVAGAPAHKVGINEDQGAAYVFTMPASGWANATQTAELTASNGASEDFLGSAVAVSGDTIVVGAEGREAHRGAAYVFTMPASGWANATQTAELTASDGAAGDHFGTGVAISGDTIVVGASSHKVGAHAEQGAAYVFTMPASGWANANQTAELTASDGGVRDNLGWAVAVSGDTIVVGAPRHKVGAHAAQGAAYVFTMPASGWAGVTRQTAKLTASNGGAGDHLGWEVGVSGKTIVAGAPFHAVGSNEHQGAAYVFRMPASGWARATRQTAELTASNGRQGDGLGWAVGVSGNTIVAGAPYRQVGADEQRGMAYVFTMPASGWRASSTQTAELTASAGSVDDHAGLAVAVSGNTIVAGAPFHRPGVNAYEGAAYAFVASLATLSRASQSHSS